MKIKRITEEKKLFLELEKYDNSATRDISARVGSLSEYAKKLYNNAENYVIEKEEEIGFLSFYANEKAKRYAYLILIAVDNAEQNKGVGGAAVQYMEKVCREKKFKGIRLEVDKKNNKAISFYRGLGFEIIEDASDLSYYMEKEIEKNVELEKERAYI